MFPLLLFVSLQAAAPPPGVVEGAVVDSLTGAPVDRAKVLVRYVKPPPGASQLSSANALGPETVTAEDGRFRLEVPGGATFRFIVEREGYTPFGGDRKLFGPDPEPHYTLSSGQTRKGIVIHLEAECSISGRAIDDETGQPAPGLETLFFRNAATPQGPPNWTPAGRVTTGPAGAFLKKGLAPGEYQIYTHASLAVEAKLSEAPVEPSFGYPGQFYPNSFDRKSALSFQLLTGSRLEGVEIKLRRERFYSVRGRLRLDGDPLKVNLWSIQPLFGGDGARHGPLAVLPGPGAFVIRNLPRGWIRLSATVAPAGGQPRRLALQRIDILNDDIDGIELDLRPGVRVEVQVRSHGLKDDQADPLWVQLKPSLKIGLSPLDRTSSGDDESRPGGATGKAEFPNVFFEPLAFGIGGLPQGWVLRELLYNGQPVSEVIPSLNTGAISHTLTALVCPVANSITGRAKDGDRPAAGAQIAAVRAGTPDETIRQYRFRRARADAEGNFTLATLAPGEYRVVVLPAQASPDQITAALLTGAGEKADVLVTGSVRLDLSLTR